MGFPPSFLISSVHRKSFCEQLQSLYNAHFQLAAMMPEPAAAISAATQAALLAHAQVAASHIYTTQGVGVDSLSAHADTLLHTTSGLQFNNKLIPTNRFSVITTSSNHTSTLGRHRVMRLEFDDSPRPFKHPAEQFLATLPSKYRGHIFHRCGYMFATRRTPKNFNPSSSIPIHHCGEWQDTAALFLNRPTATYRFLSPADVEQPMPVHSRKHLLVTVCVEKPISPYSNIVKSRDLRGSSPMAVRAAGKATLNELLLGRDECDDDDFFIWAESIGRAVAMNECRLHGTSDYFVPQSLAHTKKMNPVGDKSSWTCFKIHLYTPYREIGVIACRRKCLPPYFDTYQDIVFVMYGRCAPNDQPLQPQYNNEFMEELEMIVDTLSPTVVPLPYHYAQGLSLRIVHPTYADVLTSQIRVNSLLTTPASYQWLATRQWISSTRGEIGIFPTTEFLGSACYRLAKSFANSILVRVTHRRERLVWSQYLPVAIEGIGAEATDAGDITTHTTGPMVNEEEKEEGGGEKEKEKEKDKDKDDSSMLSQSGDESLPKHSLVADPMIIVSRMLTEFASVEATTRRRQGRQVRTYSGEEEWRCRVSQYLAYCIDDGIFPGALNIKRLLSVLTRAFLDAPILSAETSMKLDRVIDFLLYMKRRCGVPIQLPSYEQARQAVQMSLKSKRLGQRDRNGGASGHSNDPYGRETAGGGYHSHAPKHATAEVTASTSPFAALHSNSPAALFREAVPEDAGTYDYDESTTLLQKLRDPELVANFTCNESIMISLLDTSYIESLEKATIGTAQQQEGSVIPSLLISLLTKDYNVDLIRAVRDKIIAYDLHDALLIAPLIALMKDGTMQTSQYALHALTLIARYHPSEVIAAGGASQAMWFVFMSKSELLLAASIDLILVLFSDATRNIFAQPLFAMKLVDLLRKRVGGARYQNIVLQKTSLLMFKLAKIPELLNIFLSNHAHRELVQIIGEYDKKRPILLETSVCLAQLFVYAKNKMLGHPSENAKEDASVIVQTMAKCTTKSQLRICLNLLVALQILIRLPKAFYARLSNTMTNKHGGVQFTAPDKAFESRILVLQHLHTREGLEVRQERCNDIE